MFFEKIPKVLKVSFCIDITATKLKLDYVGCKYSFTKTVQSWKLVSFNVYFYYIQVSTIQIALPVVFKSNDIDWFFYIKVNIEMLKFSLRQAS